MIEIRTSHDKGRTVVAKFPISAGQLIDSAPATTFPFQDWEFIRQTSLFVYTFVRPDEYQQREDIAPGYIVFGPVSLCNHANQPNAYVKWIEDEVGIWANLTALRDIAADEEVTMYYTNISDYSNTSTFV